MTPSYVYAILIASWIAWLIPFFLVRRKGQQAQKVDTRARWGILIVALGYAFLWQGNFWMRYPAIWQIALSLLFFALAALLSWTGALALGKQWRMDAGLNADHELVMSGAYRFVRHPIYTSMFCMMLGTGFLMTPWWFFLPAVACFVIGTEIRIRVEESLLASRFGPKFDEYKKRVPAYVPFLR